MEDTTLFKEFEKVPAECKKLSIPGEGKYSGLKKLNFGKRLQAKKKKYCHKNIIGKKLLRNAAVGTLKTAGGILVPVITVHQYQRFADWLAKPVPTSTNQSGLEHRWYAPTLDGNLGGAAGIGAGIAGVLTGAFNSVFDFFEKGRMSLPEGLTKVHEEIKKESAEYVANLPSDFQAAIAAIDSRITQDLGNQQSDVALKKLSRREEVLMSFPHQVMNIAHYDKFGDESCRQVIDENVNKLIKSYPPENYEVLKVLIQQIRDNSFLKNPNPAQAYLYGPPGTGKTTFVRRLGKALGLDVCEISVNNLESQGLLGVDHSDEWVSLDDFKVIGRVGDCFRKAKTKNLIIFFDEASHIMSNYQPGKGYDYSVMKRQMLQEDFKKLLDPTNRTLTLHGIGITLDISRATMIFAGNYPISNEALLNRVPQIIFKRLDLKEKTDAVQFAFNQTFQEFGDFLHEDEVKAIEQISMDYIDFILEEDEQRNPGARVAQLVMKEFINYVRTLVQEEKLTGASVITDEKLEQFILESFRRREKLQDL